MTSTQTVDTADLPAQERRPVSWGDIAVTFARTLASPDFPRGDLAELRRMDPDAPDAAVVWRLLARYELLGSPQVENKWALILHGIALMTPTASGDGVGRSAHDGAMPVGSGYLLRRRQPAQQRLLQRIPPQPAAYRARPYSAHVAGPDVPHEWLPRASRSTGGKWPRSSSTKGMTRMPRNRRAAASPASTTERNDNARRQSKLILNRQTPLKGFTAMSVSRFLQIHSLHSYPAALLNRDDSGLAKRMPFGDAVRTRISSQCLKRHWRTANDDYAIHNIPNAAKAIRSRNVIDREVIQPLREGGGVSEEVLTAVEDAFNIGVYGSSGTSESGRQPLLLGLPEVTYLREKAKAICHATRPRCRGRRPEREGSVWQSGTR